MDRNSVIALINESVESLLDERDTRPPTPLSEETVLFGKGGLLDSLALVSLIVDLEQQVDDRGTAIILGDERAVSQKHSPFRTVASLADYILQLVEEQAHA